MNAKKIITVTLAALIASVGTLAKTSGTEIAKKTHSREQIVASMIANHDENKDGSLNTSELTRSIEALYDRRQNAIRNHRDALVKSGMLSEMEASNGIITLSLLPEDGADILMSRADRNKDQALGADELIESTRIWHTLNLGSRPYFGPSS